MIQLNKNYSLPDALAETVPVKVVSVGDAGLNALDRIVLDGLEKASVVSINTDVQSLTSSVAAHKVQRGRTRTRGLGTGGDPELGYEAAVESADEIREALTDTRMVFVCAGLGGGTGSGAAPYVAHLAREAGALVIAFVTLPFTFEGKRRATQAREALGRLNEIAHSVICFENDRMGDLVAPQAGIHHAFAMADTTISQSVRSVVNLIQRPGLIRIGFDDLLAALRVRHGRCLFGFGESDSDNRAHDALTQALKNPLMDRGRILADASHVLVHVAGGPAMTLSEVEILMKELGRHISDHTHIIFGTSVDGRMGNRLSVTLISSLATEGELAPAKKAKVAKPEPIVEPQPEAVVPSAPPVWEEREEPSPIEEPSAFAPELIHVAEPEPEITPEPEPMAFIPEEPILEESPPQP